jgi:hypothetical protein
MGRDLCLGVTPLAMVRQFFSLTVAVELIIAAVWALTLWLMARYYAKPLDGKSIKLKSDYLKTPTSNALTVLGLVVPILVALTSYLYASRPDANYGSLLTTIILYFGVLVLAIWETFAIIKRAKDDDSLLLSYPDDRRFITGLGLMYGMLILGLCYFAFFFLFEIRPQTTKPITSEAKPSAATYLVARPPISLDTTRDQLLQSWGSPHASTDNTCEYALNNGVMRVSFDKTGRVEQFAVTRYKTPDERP